MPDTEMVNKDQSFRNAYSSSFKEPGEILEASSRMSSKVFPECFSTLRSGDWASQSIRSQSWFSRYSSNSLARTRPASLFRVNLGSSMKRLIAACSKWHAVLVNVNEHLRSSSIGTLTSPSPIVLPRRGGGSGSGWNGRCTSGVFSPRRVTQGVKAIPLYPAKA
ncbi:hypothetical protein AVEN_113364-1 [Araneus ventricosus]|uniref:Uncharacterized protein n=1 Tax=Araneus ventricosus TaxID=182803 RepID=A0A4Y2IQ28_ARAVE|nr:hypothetical protein AVEN_113364-1 [Araneus ventricosus]